MQVKNIKKFHLIEESALSIHVKHHWRPPPAAARGYYLTRLKTQSSSKAFFSTAVRLLGRMVPTSFLKRCTSGPEQARLSDSLIVGSR